MGSAGWAVVAVAMAVTGMAVVMELVMLAATGKEAVLEVEMEGEVVVGSKVGLEVLKAVVEAADTQAVAVRLAEERLAGVVEVLAEARAAAGLPVGTVEAASAVDRGVAAETVAGSARHTNGRQR